MNGWILAQSTGKYLASAEPDTVLAYVGLEILVECYKGMLAVALSRVPFRLALQMDGSAAISREITKVLVVTKTLKL